MPSGYGGASDDVSRRCRLATTALADLAVEFGYRRQVWLKGCLVQTQRTRLSNHSVDG